MIVRSFPSSTVQLRQSAILHLQHFIRRFLERVGINQHKDYSKEQLFLVNCIYQALIDERLELKLKTAMGGCLLKTLRIDQGTQHLSSFLDDKLLLYISQKVAEKGRAENLSVSARIGNVIALRGIV